MKFLIITVINLALIAFAKSGYLHSPYSVHDLHSNSISSYSSHQSFPGATSYQAFETLGLPLPSYTPASHVPYGLTYVPRQHVSYHPQLAAYPIHNQPALITQNPSLIQQYPSFIQQQPTFINQIPPTQGLFPQNPIPSEPQQVSNIPQGAQVDADTVSVEAVRSNDDVQRQQVNNDDDDSVSIEAADQPFARFRSSNDTTQAIFSSTENSASTSTTTTESSAQSSNSQQENVAQTRNSQQESVAERLQYLNEARRNIASGNVISRSFFGNPSVFARFNLQ